MGIDRTGGIRNGRIYLTYADKNTGSSRVYLRSSSDWTIPIRVDADEELQWFPSIAVDQVSGYIFISYYKMIGPNYSTKRYMAISTDGGTTFSKTAVSNAPFTPSPLIGSGYMGDYYETAANSAVGYSCWSDNTMAYVSKFSAPVDITVDQMLSDNNTHIGTIGRWNVNSFYPHYNPGDQFTVQGGTIEVFQGDQSLYNGEKYRMWNNDPDVKNHHVFYIDGSTNRYVSNFRPTYSGITIQNALTEYPSASGGLIGFQDPWLIDYPDPDYGYILRNRGQDDAQWYDHLLSPFNPNTSSS